MNKRQTDNKLREERNELIHLGGLDDLAKRTIFKILSGLTLAMDTFQLINQLMWLENPFSLINIPSKFKHNINN
jgi:hypothetical protein